MRSPRAAIVDVGADVVLIGRDGGVRRLDAAGSELARAVIGLFAMPLSEHDAIVQVEALAGEPLGARRAVVEQLIALLVEVGAIVRAGEARAAERAARAAAGANVVVGISGAIAASQAPALVGALHQCGHRVEVALTANAARFVARDALAAIARREPHVSMWPAAAHAPVPHVALAEWAELVIIYPASATTIGRIANGDFSDLVAATALTTRAPVVIVPAMNGDMLAAPAMQRNLDKLRSDGHTIVHGVPAREVADAPELRASHAVAGGAPSPTEIVAAIEALRTAGVLRAATAGGARDWDAAYARAGSDAGLLVPWASDACDADLAAAMAEHAPPSPPTSPPRRVLDVGCGLGQVARHAAAAGHRVVAIDVSEVALAAARARRGGDSIVWLRDDICAPALLGPFDAIVDRATLHSLPRERAGAWARAITRLAADDAIVIVKAHRDGAPGATTGWTAAALAELLPAFDVIVEHAAELPSPRDRTPIAAVLVVLRKRR